jgi:hypothetical protein
MKSALDLDDLERRIKTQSTGMSKAEAFRLIAIARAAVPIAEDLERQLEDGCRCHMCKISRQNLEAYRKAAGRDRKEGGR